MLKCGGCTDLGRSRPVNEDGYYISNYLEELSSMYAIVADGMGGHLAGEVASGLAITYVSELINERFCAQMNRADIKDLLISAVKAANTKIYEKSRKDAECIGMGTTLTMCFVWGDTAFVAHVGDSRAYILRDDAFHQITGDHSLVQELLASGRITKEEAEHHPQKNVITRALGTDANIEIDMYELPLVAKDTLLLCSDGLSNMLTDEEIKTILQKGKKETPESLATRLVFEANQKGGYDNITAVLLTKDAGKR